MTIAIAAGSRHIHIGHVWWPLLDAAAESYRITEVWHGGANGADEGVAFWAKARGLTVEAFPAPWDLFKQAGLKAKAAGARRIDDMLSGLRGYIIAHSKHDPEAVDGIVCTQQLGTRGSEYDLELASKVYRMKRPDSPASVLLALPGYAGTRRTIRAAQQRGLVVERLSVEPWVINRWHYRRKDGSFDLPPDSMNIQRGTALGNPYEVGAPHPHRPGETISAEECLQLYRGHLWRLVHARDRGVMAMLHRITARTHLVCTCKRPDGTGLCHGDVVVRAWRFVHGIPQPEAQSHEHEDHHSSL